MSIASVGRINTRLEYPSLRQGLVAFLLTISLGCVQNPGPIPGSGEGSEWRPWQVLDTQTGRILSSSEWLKGLSKFEVVYLGEEHHNQYHIEAALTVLRQLSSDGLRPAIGMEMFGWDGQPALDAYLSKDGFSRREFLEQVRWAENWGGAFEDYEPLVIFARERGLSVRAMNPPKQLIRRIVKVGLAQVRAEPEWKQWNMDREEIVDDPAYRARIIDQLRRCHGGGALDQFHTMYEASMVRDEGMARTIAAQLDELRRDKGGSRHVLVSYTGGGHIQYGLPVPMRVARRMSGDVKQTTIYLASFDAGRMEEIQELVREKIADYIWLTPTSKKGSLRRC